MLIHGQSDPRPAPAKHQAITELKYEANKVVGVEVPQVSGTVYRKSLLKFNALSSPVGAGYGFFV